MIFRIFMTLMLLSTPLMAANKQWKEIFNKKNITVFAAKGDYRIIPFKAEAVYDVNFEKVFQVIRDWKTKHQWSPKLKSVKMHEQIDENEFIFSEYYKTPWPATDREFLLKGTIIKKENAYNLRAKSIERDDLKDNDHIQCDVRVLNFDIIKLGENKTKVVFEFHGDMKGWMPAWLINIIQKKWPYRFLESLHSRI